MLYDKKKEQKQSRKQVNKLERDKDGKIDFGEDQVKFFVVSGQCSDIKGVFGHRKNSKG